MDWIRAWGKKYPVLLRYPEQVDPAPYARQIEQMLDTLARDCHYSEQDAMLVLKDILYQTWKRRRAR